MRLGQGRLIRTVLLVILAGLTASSPFAATLIGSVLAAHVVLKDYAVIRAQFWAFRHSRDYVSDFQDNPPESFAAMRSRLRAHHAIFFPFGAKDLRIHDWAEARGNDTLAKYSLMWSRSLSANFPLTWISVGYLVVTSVAVDQPSLLLVGTLGAALLVLRTAMTYESIYWYLVHGSYEGIYLARMSRQIRNVDSDQDQRWEAFRSLRSIGGASLASMVATVAALHRAGPLTFHGMNTQHDFGAQVSGLVEAGYYVTTTVLTVGYGDIYPQGNLGQFLATLIMINGALSLTILVSYIIGSTRPKRT